MFVELLYKEFLLEVEGENRSPAYRVLSNLLKLLVYAGLIALLCYVYIALDNKIEAYSSYGAYDFLILFLGILFVFGVLGTTVKARKIIFDKMDRQLLLPLPLSGDEIISAKFAYLAIKAAFLQLFTAVPLLICYGALRGEMVQYYVFCLLYAPFISFSITGVALVLVVPYQFIYKLIKMSDVAQFVVASILVVALCFAYRYVLNVFLTALNDSSIGGVFSDDFINGLHGIVEYVLPIANFTNAVVREVSVVSNVCWFLGISVLVSFIGYSISAFFYNRLMKREFNPAVKKDKQKKLKVDKPFKALLKKEFDLLFREGTYAFSYTSLLIMEPFLAFVVISSLNDIIYDNLKFYAVYFPELISGINLTLILLFSSVIGASAALSITREERSVIIMKYIPQPPFRQILAKITVPTILSFASLLITVSVLFGVGLISFYVFLVGIAIGAIMIVFENFLGIYADMDSLSAKKGRLRPFAAIYSVGWPLMIVIAHFAMSVYAKFPAYQIYLIEIGASLLWLLFVFIRPKYRLQRAFERMEVNG